MNDSQKTAMAARLTAMADDELILAHRDAEWTGHAPILEEDIALANLAQDELGHATVYYGLLETLTGIDGDQMAFFREAADFRNVQLVELPKGDWAVTMLRHYLVDAYEHVLLDALQESLYAPLRDAAAKIRREELYHLRHGHIWVERLGLGTEESNRRMQTAVSHLWPYCNQLFTPMAADDVLIEAGYFVDVMALRPLWQAIVIPHLTASGLIIPETAAPVTANRSTHTPHLADLLADMQMVARADPQAAW